MKVREVLLRRSRLPWVIAAALAVVAGIAVLLVAVLDEPARPHYCSCRPPPDTSAVEQVPRDWQAAAAHRDAQAAWRLLTPEAQRRYGTPGRLRSALARIAPDPRGPAEWRLVDTVTQGRGTPSTFLYLLVEKRTLRPAGAVVVHSMAAGAADGRVDPAPAATVRIVEPAAHAKLGDRPPMRAATADPPVYVAVQAGRVTFGTAGAIRGPDGRDAPFTEPLRPGPTLIVAVRNDGNGRFAYGSVRVTIR
ncbi:hypothetical protein [Actinomadura verrucosospora]|uniref:Uncharacterized protein n=1 Tax=Actinomadura verrucosospora TaxID=46165 RepID=A0A7D3ZLN0_ACTVE|nr:hypothetical protein [Actinomadura verrucosospora]QKG23241.1 hypothetical protein ACTIVE_4884 [Actinomadura verrucosospora]